MRWLSDTTKSHQPRRSALPSITSCGRSAVQMAIASSMRPEREQISARSSRTSIDSSATAGAVPAVVPRRRGLRASGGAWSATTSCAKPALAKPDGAAMSSRGESSVGMWTAS